MSVLNTDMNVKSGSGLETTFRQAFVSAVRSRRASSARSSRAPRTPITDSS